MGRIIRKGDVATKVQTMNAELQLLQMTISETRNTFSEIMGVEANLNGVAWNQFRNYLQHVHVPVLDAFDLWIQGMIEANTSYGNAAAGLSESLLNEFEIDRQINEMINNINHE